MKPYGIPNELIHLQGINFIANRFGMPLLTNAVVAKQSRLDFIRVCIEQNVSNILAKEVKFYEVSEELYIMRIVYEWNPLIVPPVRYLATLPPLAL